ncbi:hypothetical protein BKA63DRAFT_487882 [Paraphoma chrysanthemicola]|nr:hypothetical protein BKA63DRAFT_487882 [Paraphoma chrysanthemicola]
MSSISVPCRAPYRPIAIHSDDETVNLKSRLTHQPVDVHYHIYHFLHLRNYLTYSRLLDRDDNLIRESLIFPRESPVYFQVALNFLQYGRLQHPNLRTNTKDDIYFAFLAELYGFASHYALRSFRSALLDAFFLCMLDKKRIAYGSIRDVYNNTNEQSLLRDLVIDVTLNIGTSKDIEHYKRHLPLDFWIECLTQAGRDGIVPFRQGGKKGKGKGVDKWLRGKRERICFQYHGHSRKELEEEERRREEDEVMDGVGSGGDEGWDGEEVQIEREEVDEDGYTERTRRELGFIDELKKSKTRY